MPAPTYICRAQEYMAYPPVRHGVQCRGYLPDGLVPTLDDENHITNKTYWAPPQLYVTSSAMVAGSTDGGYGDATAINTGTITVNNAGFGMMALNGGTAINRA